MAQTPLLLSFHRRWWVKPAIIVLAALCLLLRRTTAPKAVYLFIARHGWKRTTGRDHA